MSIIMSHVAILVCYIPSTATMTHPEAPLVPLPSRMNNSVNTPVWSIDNTTPSPKCGRTDGVCCKELIKDERTLVDPDVVRDVYASLLTGYSNC